MTSSVKAPGSFASVPILATWQQEARIRPLDRAFGEFIASLEPVHGAIMGQVAALLSARAGQQDVCVPLATFVPLLPDIQSLEGLAKVVTQSATVAQVTLGQDPRAAPMVFDHGQLYLQRYWAYEVSLAAALLQRGKAVLQPDEADVKAKLEALNSDAQGIDWQKVAIALASSKRLCFITGGPGTGKTTTVTQLMALVQGQAMAGGRTLDIRLVAPTGKAATRLGESIAGGIQYVDASIAPHLPTQCQTLHRLLGARPSSPYFRHNRDNPLRMDMLIVDEASMIDLPLMSKLFDALDPNTRVVLLGDKDQLASVEVGAVLGDICAAASIDGFSAEMLARLNSLTGAAVPLGEGGVTSGIDDCLVTLKKSHRFSETSPIGRLARAINDGDLAETHRLLQHPNDALAWYSTPEPGQLLALAMPGLKQYFDAVQRGELADCFRALANQQILTAMRGGPLGVTAINDMVTHQLHRQGLIDARQEYYPGRPIIISENNHQLQLYNGDIGILLADDNGLIKAWFATAEGFRGVLPSRLPAHETVYAMTIHKSQGSEFSHAILCLPPYCPDNLLTRELLYTGLTRAKVRFSLFAPMSHIGRCLNNQVKRGSGLKQRLLRPAVGESLWG